MPRTLSSSLVLSATAYLFKPFLSLGLKNVQVNGLPYLLDALRERPDAALDKGKGRAVEGTGRAAEGRRGIVTVCNHNSVMDDPLAWCTMPLSTFFPFASPTTTSRNSRWTLGARDIMFTNPAFSKFFELGQVISTERGGGIFQPAIDQAIQLLQNGEWIHIFPEGKVNQQSSNPEGGLLRFKWGIGRIIMDSETMPEIIPMWISGFDQVMPEPRNFPRFLPRPGGSISINFGPPLTPRIQPLVGAWREIASKESGTVGVGGRWEGDSPEGQRLVRSEGRLADGREEAVRIDITNALQEGVRELGEQVERREGRYDRGEWCQSRRRVQ